jgi:tetratricopeptide (TPR) repeat protein
MSERINACWSRLREDSAGAIRLRRRLGAVAAMGLVVSGFLAAIGLGLLVLAFFGGMVIGLATAAGLIAAVEAWPHVRAAAAAAARAARSSARIVRAQAARRAGSSARIIGAQAVRGARRTRSSTAVAFEWTSRRAAAALASGNRGAAAALASGGRRVTAGRERFRRDVIRATNAAATQLVVRRAPAVQREALRLNTAGTQHRRNGRYAAAVACHRQALALLLGVDDAHAVALTQNNLALALSHDGDDESAIRLFEQAAATLRVLGDDEHEAQVIANLGLAHRRHGRQEEGDNVLQLALTKLNPTSRAYHTVEAQLQRAS